MERGTVRGDELQEKRLSLINRDLPYVSHNASLDPLCRNRQPGSPGGIVVQPHPPGRGSAPAVSTILLLSDWLCAVHSPGSKEHIFHASFGIHMKAANMSCVKLSPLCRTVPFKPYIPRCKRSKRHLRVSFVEALVNHVTVCVCSTCSSTLWFINQESTQQGRFELCWVFFFTPSAKGSLTLCMRQKWIKTNKLKDLWKEKVFFFWRL